MSIATQARNAAGLCVCVRMHALRVFLFVFEREKRSVYRLWGLVPVGGHGKVLSFAAEESILMYSSKYAN
ncbi:hypothetical protein EVAR_56060_1 [Eumeta japonica]|uniref:Uncharacterized protein n=1 Tax=Eumeta variegata TaxID=151549 RepID=A0A4C1Y989_EUMVA|nr:hypothetical protein EVAR_56060_1 [Eumeta japonica]